MEEKIVNENLLLPGKFKLVGYALMFPALILAAVRFRYGIKPEIFEFKEFAIYSSYLETKTFSVIQNNFADEIVGILFLFSLVFIAFSKEEVENETVMLIRLKSFFIALYANVIFLLFVFLFIYGIGFIKATILNMYFFLVVYILVFRYYYLFKYGKSIAGEK